MTPIIDAIILPLKTAFFTVWNFKFSSVSIATTSSFSVEKKYILPVIKKETKEKESYYRSKKDRAEEVRISNLIKKTEKEIEELEEQITTLTKEISDENISSDYELLSKKCEELDKTKELLNEKYNFWEELNM